MNPFLFSFFPVGTSSVFSDFRQTIGRHCCVVGSQLPLSSAASGAQPQSQKARLPLYEDFAPFLKTAAACAWGVQPTSALFSKRQPPSHGPLGLVCASDPALLLLKLIGPKWRLTRAEATPPLLRGTWTWFKEAAACLYQSLHWGPAIACTLPRIITHQSLLPTASALELPETLYLYIARKKQNCGSLVLILLWEHTEKEK